MPWKSLLTSVLISIAAASIALSDRLACDDGMFVVEADDSNLASRLCQMSSEIRTGLAACGLEQLRPLEIEVSAVVTHPLPNCLAYFDCDYDLIQITDPASLPAATAGDPVFSLLPSEVTLRALLTHELAHALATQMAGERVIRMVDQEYIAAAMELDLMEPASRKLLLDIVDADQTPYGGLIDIWIYRFEPRVFAVNAWRHFSLDENGCILVGRLVAGEFSFAQPILPELQ